MKNIKLVVEYDGTDFIGWQIQREGRSVQAVIQEKLIILLGEKVNLIAAGRTDSGVHARGQVVNFKTDTTRSNYTILRALNDLLPDDIIIHEVSEAPLNFNARYDAVKRIYRYYISLRPLAIGKKYSWYCYYKLNPDLLDVCANFIMNIKNFKSFCYTKSEVKNHLCDIYSSFWIKKDDSLIFEISANRFLHGMVRSLVGTMIDVSRGYISFDKFKSIFEKEDRRFATKAAPPCGLILEKVIYPEN